MVQIADAGFDTGVALNTETILPMVLRPTVPVDLHEFPIPRVPLGRFVDFQRGVFDQILNSFSKCRHVARF